MPVLPPAYFGNLQKVKISDQWYLLEKFSQTQKNTLSAKPMIQGTIGTRIMDVGELIWETSIESSPLISGDGKISTITDPPAPYSDIFVLMSNAWNNIRIANLSNGQPTLPLMESAVINITKEKVNINLTLVSGYDELKLFKIIKEPIGSAFIARLVKWYDCTLIIKESMPNGFSQIVKKEVAVGVESATINLKAKITPRFFIGFQSQEPFFSIDNYEVSGSMTLIANAAQMQEVQNYIVAQQPGVLNKNGPAGLELYIGSKQSIDLGINSLKSEFTRTVSAGDVNRITIKFTSFTT